VVSWLPLYHDMGLIGSYLGALYCGGTGVYMSPLSFIRRPPLWLELISTHKGTHMQVRGCGCSTQRHNKKTSGFLPRFALVGRPLGCAYLASWCPTCVRL
jgi:acyl-CoA synthetase (AMP-forming)/AMP-acid ligase II